MTRPTLCSLALPLLLLGACQPAPRSSGGSASAAVNAACRVEVDRVYAAQNRADLSRRDERDTPFASSYLPGITTRQLSQQYARGNQMAECVAANSNGQATPPAPSTPGPTFSPAARVN